MIRFCRWASASVAFLLVFDGCGGGGDTGGTTGPTPAISISLSKSSLTIQQGGNDNLVASVTKSGGFSGDVTIAVEGIPAGVTGALSNITTTGATVTVNVAVSVTPGSYNVVVRASGPGVTSVTATATLTVTAIPAIGIALSSATPGVNQGASGQVTVTINRTNYTGNVSFALEGTPAGVTGTFVPAPAPGATTTLTVQVAASVAIANYNMTVRATGTGVTDATAALVLTVNPAPAITISLSAAAVSVDQGASGQSVVTIARTNFTGAVTLALEGAPTGVTGTFVPAPAPGTTSTLTIQVDAAVVATMYPLTVRATGDGIAAATASLALTVTVPASYSMTASSPSITLGASGPGNIAITRSNFTGAIALTLEGAPAGVSGSFNPASVTASASVLTLTVGGTVAAGAYPMTVRGVASGLADRTANFTLTVTPVQGGYTLAISPVTPVNVSQGGGVALPVTIIRTGGFTGAVSLSASGPNGLTTTFSPASTTGTVSALSLLPAQSMSADPYSITITGTAVGLADRTLGYNFNVSVPNVSLDFTGCGTGTPIWFAIQDGVNGPWVQTLAPGGQYRTRTAQSAVALAMVTSGFGSNHSIQVQYMTNTELQNSSGDVVCGNPILPARTAVVSTANLTTFQTAFVNFGGASRVFSSSLTGGTLSGVLPGMHDLVSHSATQSGGWGPSERLIIRRDLNPASGGSLGVPLDYTSVEAFAPTTATISISPLLPGEILNSTNTVYVTGASCLSAPLWGVFVNAAQTSFTAYGVPVAKQRPSDLHGISLNTYTPGVQFRFVTEYVQALTNQTVALPSSLPIPTITTLPAGYQRLQFQFTAPSDLAAAISASYALSSGRSVFLTATSGWLGGTSVSLSVPDFGASANWDDSWGPPLNPAQTTWNLTGAGSALGGACAAGGRVTAANRTGTF